MKVLKNDHADALKEDGADMISKVQKMAQADPKGPVQLPSGSWTEPIKLPSATKNEGKEEAVLEGKAAEGKKAVDKATPADLKRNGYTTIANYGGNAGKGHDVYAPNWV